MSTLIASPKIAPPCRILGNFGRIVTPIRLFRFFLGLLRRSCGQSGTVFTGTVEALPRTINEPFLNFPAHV